MAQLPGNDSDNCYNDTLNNTYCTESDTNWLNSSFWTMNPEYDTFTAYSLNGVGYVDHMEVHCTSNVGPVVYLKPDIVLGGESGVDAEHAMTILP